MIKTLQIKPELRMTIINPPAGYMDRMGPLPEGVDFVEKLYPKATGVLEYDGIFWISYPKKSSGLKTDLDRDILWKRVENKGLRPVTAVSIDDVWSALRFRPPEMIKSKK